MKQARRREFLTVMGALLAAPLRGFAQQPGTKIPRIGFLGVSTSEAWAPRLDAFRAGLRDLGYVEGKTSSSSIDLLKVSMIVFRIWPPSSSG